MKYEPTIAQEYNEEKKVTVYTLTVGDDYMKAEQEPRFKLIYWLVHMIVGDKEVTNYD